PRSCELLYTSGPAPLRSHRRSAQKRSLMPDRRLQSAPFRKSSCHVPLGSPCIILHLEAQSAYNIVLSSTWGSCQVGYAFECFDCALVRGVKSTTFSTHLGLMVYGTPHDTPAADSREKHEVFAPLLKARSGSPFAWAGSLWFDLGIAAVAGLLYALLVMGPGPLNPRNVDWLTPDTSCYYIGWELFRQDPKLHWPLTYTDRLGYPEGESVALLDLNPLLAVALKPLSPLLPEPLQYFGLEVVLACALQFFFAFRIFRRILGANVLGIALCSAFFLLSPPLNYRFMEHYSLTNQWVLLAALLVFLQAQHESSNAIRRFVISAVVLTAISVGINPYLALQVLLMLTAVVASLLWKRRLTLRRAAGIMMLLCVTGFAMAYSLGFVIEGGRGYAGRGFRFYSMNVLSPFDPHGWKSIILPRLPQATEGQYEVYNYLGAGVLLLALIVLATAFFQRRKLPSPDKHWLMPLLVCCFVLTLMALSTNVTVGSVTLVDLDPRERLSAYLAPLRSSGRFFWTPYYLILIVVLAA